MAKSLFEELGGKYERQGDYLIPCLTVPAEEEQAIGIWGQRHLDYLKQYRKVTYTNLLTSGRLNAYLADINRQAQERFERLIEGMKQAQWSYVKKKYKLNVTNFLCSERSLTCYFYCILLDVFKILFLIFIWRQISTMTVNAYGIIKCFDVFKNQFMCMCIIKDFKPVDPFSLQKCMERFYTGVIPWICFL